MSPVCSSTDSWWLFRNINIENKYTFSQVLDVVVHHCTQSAGPCANAGEGIFVIGKQLDEFTAICRPSGMNHRPPESIKEGPRLRCYIRL